MTTSISELIAEKIDAMPASERKAAQTLIANYPLIGLRTVAEFSTQAGREFADDSPFCFPPWASRATRISRERCRRNWRRRCNRLGTARATIQYLRKTARYSLSWKPPSRIFARPSSIFRLQQLDDVTRRHQPQPRTHLSSGWPLYRSDCQIHGCPSQDHPAGGHPPHWAGKPLARPPDRHGQERCPRSSLISAATSRA